MTEVPLEKLLDYWLGELDPAEEEQLEERLFSDEGVARRLAWVSELASEVAALVRGGQLAALGSTVEAVERLEREGATVRSYRVPAGSGVACTVASEDMVAIRLAGAFETDEVDVVMEASFEGGGTDEQRLARVPVDARTGEVVLLYAGDRIRALPRSKFRYRAGGLEFFLDHTPPGGG